MAKDYSDDIPLDEEEDTSRHIPIKKARESASEDDAPLSESETEAAAAVPKIPERSIRNIAPSSRPRVSRTPLPHGSESGPIRAPQPYERIEKNKNSRIVLWALVLLVLAIFGFAISSIFRKTTVTIVPRTHTIVFDDQLSYTAYPQGSDQAPTGGLVYTTETKRIEASTAVTASGTEEVSEAASGTITVFNEYSEDPVRLIKNTRFETPDGKIFRVRDSIVIPGKSGSTPGQSIATVHADEPGESYNIGPVARFSVPGLKDSPDMYANIYARSDTAMSGGFIGTRPSVTPAERERAEAQLTENLAAQMAGAFSANDDRYPILPYADIAYAPLTLEEDAAGGLVAKKTATVVVPVIARAALDTFLAGEMSAGSEGSPIRINDPSTFSIQAANEGVVPTLGTDTLEFSLRGSALFVYIVDEESLVADLAGKNKAIFESVVSAYPSIESASAKVYPLWSGNFPDNPESMRIVVETPVAEN